MSDVKALVVCVGRSGLRRVAQIFPVRVLDASFAPAVDPDGHVIRSGSPMQA